MDTGRTLRELEQIPSDLAKALRRLAELQIYATEYKATAVAEKEEQYDWMTVEATLEAMADGTCDGKNQKTRDVQLTAYLAKHNGVRGGYASLEDVQSELRDKEAAVITVQADVKALSYQLRAAMATAELQSALLNAGKRERDE